MILIIDNYDSFVYNLARYVNELNFKTKVIRNDELTLKQIEALNPSHIIISPGPCTPNEAGISLSVIEYFKNKTPILGVCLGHQAIAQVFGANIVKAKYPMHGMESKIIHCKENIFLNIPSPFTAARYHSLIVSNDNFAEDLVISATSKENEIMAICHKSLPIFGVQFHPESILTKHGYTLLNNFLKL